MPDYTHEGTEMLQQIADEVVKERERQGDREFDAHATQEPDVETADGDD